jgi:predicted MFS family arabinose efflux permease
VDGAVATAIPRPNVAAVRASMLYPLHHPMSTLTQTQPHSPMPTFSRYQKFVVAMLGFLQFTVVLDFMILSPLGALLLRDLGMATSQFGLVVSAYAFSAGISGLLTAGFADKFDRKKLLLFFYCGFVLGTFLCAIASDFRFLLIARIVTGLFGGVISSISFAIITDLFPWQTRGRVMGVVQTAFAASQVMGIPLGLYLSNRFSWHAPFFMIAGASVAVGVVIAVFLRPIDEHLKVPGERNPLQHLVRTVGQGRYLRAFGATILLATGGFMLMPFSSAFTVNNLGISLHRLPLIYMVTGVSSIVSGPIMGRLSDAIGKYPMFCAGSVVGMVVVATYCNLGPTPIGGVIAINVVLFIAIMARMISASALTSGVPDLKDRGAFMAVNASLQQLSGGVASSVAGMIVVQQADGRLAHYNVLGYVVVLAMVITVAMMYPIHLAVKQKMAQASMRGPAPDLTGAAPPVGEAAPASLPRP